MWHRWLAFSTSERRQLLQLCWSLCWIRLRLKFIRLDKLIHWSQTKAVSSKRPAYLEGTVAASNRGGDRVAGSSSSGENRQQLSSRRSDSLNSLLGSVCRFQGLSNACLPRALVLCRWLNREGISAIVRIGVTKSGPNRVAQNREEPRNEDSIREQDTLTAHAWVEVEGYCSDTTIGNFSQFKNLQARGS